MSTISELFFEGQKALVKINELEFKKKELIESIAVIDLDIIKLEERMKEIHIEVEKISEKTEILQSGSKLIKGYNPEWTNVKKVAEVLRAYGVEMTIREIIDEVIKNDKIKGIDTDDKKLMASLSSVLSTKTSKTSKDNTFYRTKEYEGAEYKYGLFEWRNKETDLEYSYGYDPEGDVGDSNDLDYDNPF